MATLRERLASFANSRQHKMKTMEYFAALICYCFDMIHFCECVFEIRVLLNSILTMGIIFNHLQLTGTRLRPHPGTQVWRTTPHNCSLM